MKPIYTFSKLCIHTLRATIMSFIILKCKRLPGVIYLNLIITLPLLYAYKDMTGKKYPKSEKLSIKITSLMLLQDYLIDEQHISLEDLKQLYLTPKSFVPQTTIEKTVKTLLLEISNGVNNKHAKLIENLTNAQINAETADNYQDLLEATEEKGLWFPTLAYPFNPDMDSDEIEVLKTIGFYLKCTDDFVDIETDKLKDNHTIFNFSKNEIDCAQLMTEIRVKITERIKSLHYYKVQKSNFYYYLAVAAQSFVYHNKLLDRMPKWYKNIMDKCKFLQIFNLVLACVAYVKEFEKIETLNYEHNDV